MVKIFGSNNLATATAKQIGNKAYNLVLLKKALGSESVPKLLVFVHAGEIPKSTLRNLHTEIKKTFKLKTTFALRSSGKNEDSKTDAQAGQYSTVLNVPLADLEKELIELMKENSKKELNCPIIIQEMTPAKYSGILFTRNPNGSREFICEWHPGLGEDIVSGKVKPESVSYYWHEFLANSLPNENFIPKTAKPWLPALTQLCSQIEQYCNWPQDIEWAWDGKNILILQTRPITTINSEQWSQIQKTETDLKKISSPYWLTYATSLNEILVHPNKFEQKLLSDIYAKNGPIAQVYKQANLNYQHQNYIQIIDNQIYTNKETEIKTILPSFSHFGNARFTESPKNTTGIFSKEFWISLTNKAKLNNIAFNSCTAALKFLYEDFIQKPAKNYSAAYKQLLKSYQLIFRIGLTAERKLHTGKNLPTSTQNKLVSKIYNTLQAPNQPKLIGNSLSFQDQTKFQAHTENLSLPLLLKEIARWLTVLRKSQLLATMTTVQRTSAQQNGEIATHTPTKNYFSKYIYQQVFKQKSQTKAELTELVPGNNNGPQVTIENISTKKNSPKQILKVTNLTPDLVKYFPYLNGIICQNGGQLSHLAIMARQAGIGVWRENN